MTDTSQTTEPEGRPPPPDRRRLTRSRTDRAVAGVAGGLAEYFGVDAVVFRIGFVAFSLLGGVGLVVYGLAWLLVPEEGAHRTLGEHLLRRCGTLLHGVSWPTVAGVVLLIIAAAVLVDAAVHTGGGKIVLSAALVAAGVGLLAWRPAVRSRVDDAQESPPSPTAGSAPSPVPPRPTNLTRPSVGVLLVAGGAAGLADAGGVVDITVEEFLAGALAFTGLALLVSAWWGRARGLLLVGALLTLALGGLAAVDVPLAAGFGERAYRPEQISEVRDRYRLFAGEMRIDLSGVDFPEGTTEIDVELAFGELRVVVPERSAVVVTAEAKAGEVRVLGETERGLGADTTRRTRGRDGSTVRLDLRVVAGEIRVTDAPS